MTVVYRPYFKKSGATLKAENYITQPFAGHVSVKDISDLLYEGHDLKMDIKLDGKWNCDVAPEKLTDEYYLMRILEFREKEYGKATTGHLTRIIKNGGFTNYVEKLEGEVMPLIMGTPT